MHTPKGGKETTPLLKHRVSQDSTCPGVFQNDGLCDLTQGIHQYLQEIEDCRKICANHASTAAVHTRGKTLQLYRLFKRDDVTAKQIRRATEELPSWEESMYWKKNGVLHRSWEKMRGEVEHRMAAHGKQHPIITRGIEWEGMPILIHAYKFEPDPVMKMELIVAPYQSPIPELSLHMIASLLKCHEHIVPNYIAAALPPFERHETKFLTIPEYLSQTMPEGLYATQCLGGVSCHASNGVGSQGTPCEHPASHSNHAKAVPT